MWIIFLYFFGFVFEDKLSFRGQHYTFWLVCALVSFLVCLQYLLYLLLFNRKIWHELMSASKVSILINFTEIQIEFRVFFQFLFILLRLGIYRLLKLFFRYFRCFRLRIIPIYMILSNWIFLIACLYKLVFDGSN